MFAGINNEVPLLTTVRADKRCGRLHPIVNFHIIEWAAVKGVRFSHVHYSVK